MASELVIWRFRDGKPGHERQTAGLLDALGDHFPLDIHDLPSATQPHAWWSWLRGTWPATAHGPAPRLVLGAGSACVWPLLAAARAFKATSVYLMKPQVPVGCFDLCFIPRHDGVGQSRHVILTEGVLNDLAPGAGPKDGAVPLLVGGPSRHHDWDEGGLLRQLAALVLAGKGRPFVIADSRRTPASTSLALRRFSGEGVHFVAHSECGPDWLRDTLARAPMAWVTADSVSMLFEARTAGCAVGVVDVPARRADRISRIAGDLEDRGQVVSLEAWLAGGQVVVLVPPLAEARRCAALLATRLAQAPCT